MTALRLRAFNLEQAGGAGIPTVHPLRAPRGEVMEADAVIGLLHDSDEHCVRIPQALPLLHACREGVGLGRFSSRAHRMSVEQATVNPGEP